MMERDKEQPSAVLARRAGGSPAQAVLWSRAAQVLAESGLKTSVQVSLLKATPHPGALEAFASLLSRSLQNREKEDFLAADRLWQQVVEVIDDTEETLPAWLAAYEVFYRWTAAQGQSPDLNGATGYLHCSALAVGTGEAYQTFPTTVSTMLEAYGYAGEEGGCKARAE